MLPTTGSPSGRARATSSSPPTFPWLTGAQAIHPTGRVFTADSIGSALASRSIGEHLRSMGEITGGPKPFVAADRSRFLQALDAAVVRARKL